MFLNRREVATRLDKVEGTYLNGPIDDRASLRRGNDMVAEAEPPTKNNRCITSTTAKASTQINFSQKQSRLPFVVIIIIIQFFFFFFFLFFEVLLNTSQHFN